jgi:hypothetical protein
VQPAGGCAGSPVNVEAEKGGSNMTDFGKKNACIALLAGALGAAAIAAPAAADPPGSFGPSKSENWGISPRNTIGSPVAELRDGPSARVIGTGDLTEPPYGKGSLGIEVSVYPGTAGPGESKQEKVDFGNEVDFFGDAIAALNEVGFHVFQTGENVARGGPGNMPNIRFEIDPPGAPAYSTMVWVPNGVSPAEINRWSDYIDATTTGSWYFTGAFGATSGCNQATVCTFTRARMEASGGTIYTVLVGKGRDNMWIGAVDGLRLNRTIYDFEENGVRSRGVGKGD